MSRLSLKGQRWDALCQQIKDRDGWACTKCGAVEDLTVDHILALANIPDDEWEDLTYDPENLTTLCRPCNGKKSDRNDDGRVTWWHPDWWPTGWRPD